MTAVGRASATPANIARPFVARAALLCVLAATGCSSDTDIVGHCESVTEPGLFLSGSNGSEYVWWSPSVGLLDDHLWVTYFQEIDGKALGFGRWYDAATLVPTGEPVHLGTVDVWELQNWVRDGSALVGQVWSDPSEPAAIAPEDEDQLVHVWRVTPPPGLSADTRSVGLATAGPWDPLWPGVWFRSLGLSALYSAGFQGAVPVAVTSMGPIGALDAVAPCEGTARGRMSIHVFGAPLLARRLPFPTEACDDGQAGTPWLFSLGDSEVGLLYRHGRVEDHQVRYIRLGPDGTPRSTSRIVGGGANAAVSDVRGGFQPRAVRVGERVLFTERRGSDAGCYTIRVVDVDGANAEDAPWQLPCADDGGYADGPVITWIHQLVSVPGAAVIVWYERTNVSGGIITDPATYREGVFAVMLTQDGKRGSAVMRLTTPDFTAAGLDAAGTPVTANETDVQVAADSNNVFATWIDRRAPDAPSPPAGYHARMVRCVVDP